MIEASRNAGSLRPTSLVPPGPPTHFANTPMRRAAPAGRHSGPGCR